MKKRIIAAVVAFSLSLISPPQITHAAEDTKTIVLADLCTDGSYESKSVSNGTQLVSSQRCKHGHNMPHWYDAATGISSENGYAYQGSWHSQTGGGLTIETVPKEKTPPTATLYKYHDIQDNTGLGVKFNVTPLYDGYVDGSHNVTVSWSCNTHAPMVLFGGQYDAKGSGTTVSGRNLCFGQQVATLGVVSGIASARASSHVTTTSHKASACSGSTVVVTGSHKSQRVTSSSNNNYYDDKGNIIGGSGSTSYKCDACGATWSNGGGGINKDYTGDVYDEHGHKVGYTGSSSGNGVSYGLDLNYLVGGYSFSTSSISNSCYTATQKPCNTHHWSGDHYYCDEHGYVGTDSKCTYATSGYLFTATEYDYRGVNAVLPVFNNKLSMDSTCAGFLDYKAVSPGHAVKVIMTKSPGSYKYTVKNDTTGAVVASGISSNSSFSYNMPESDVTITIEPGQVAQIIRAALSASSIGYGATTPTLSVTDAKTTLSYTSSNPAVATVNSDGSLTIKGLGTTTLTVTATETTSYKSATATVTLTVGKGTLSVAATPTSRSIVYGQALSASTLSGGTVKNASGTAVGGTWNWHSLPLFLILGIICF